ncbi:MAG TPA: hypothetical protein VE399_04790 [Gemmatimonadales bacterium]|nr:hypothetical protein [Gemmatimonadales bacterium]
MRLSILAILFPYLIEPPATYVGRAGQLDVHIPRHELDAVIDGSLDEPVWEETAVLTGFSQFSPTDGVPAAGPL